MTWFSLGRDEGFPANYGEQFTAAKVDVLVAGLILALVIIAVAFLLILPAYSTQKRWLTLSAYVIVSLFVGGVVVVCNFGHEWEVGHVSIRSPYKPASAEEMVGNLGLHVSLRGINITLKGDLEQHSEDITRKEVIDYNEHYSWEWAQGRFGFGPYAGRISREFRAAVMRGTPTPILITAEYFTFDGEGLRFGRHYRLAGYYAHFFMWLAFCTWALTNIALFMVVRLASIFLMVTGLSQIIAVLLWSQIRNSIEIQVPFESADGKGEVLLVTSYGPDFWLVLGNGVLCTCGGFVIFVLDYYFKGAMCQVFGIDPLSVYVYAYKPKEDDEPADVDRPGRLNLGMITEDEGNSVDNSATIIRRRHSEKAERLPAVVQIRRTASSAKSFRNPFWRKGRVPLTAAHEESDGGYQTTPSSNTLNTPQPPPLPLLETKNGSLVLVLRRESELPQNMSGKRLTSSEV